VVGQRLAGWLATVEKTVAHLDLGGAEQVEVAGDCDDQAAASGGVLDLHGPPSAGSRRRAGLPDARVAPYATAGSASCCTWLDGRSQIGPGPVPEWMGISRGEKAGGAVARQTQLTAPPAHPPTPAAILAASAALASRYVVLERRQQEAVAAARALCHTSWVHLARRRVTHQRRQGHHVAPVAWFAVQGVIGEQVVRAVWSDGQLTCDRLLLVRARLLVDLGAEFSTDDAPCRFVASLQAPPIAVLLTLIRACDLATVIEVDLGDSR
jgi:hypothetical protein